MYTSRIVGTGTHKGRPIVAFTLASRSIPYRELRAFPDKGKINVFPRQGYENHPTNIDPEVDCYACVKTGAANGMRFMASLNGHHCKRVASHLKQGLPPQMALGLTMLDFPAYTGDARIGALAYLSGGKNLHYLATNDDDRKEFRIAAYPNECHSGLDDKLLFIHDTDTRLQKYLLLRTDEMSPEGLAHYIHNNIGGRELLFGAGTGVAMLEGENFKIGVYNHPVDEAAVARWQRLYEQWK
jgi:hypothetical protein